MTLNNYWWLLIWLVVGGGILYVLFPKKPVQILGKTEYCWGWMPIIILSCPYAIWAGFRTDSFGDTGTYRVMFRDIPSSLAQLPDYLSEHTKDQGFSILMALFKLIVQGNDKIFFLLIAAFQIFCVAYFFRKYSTNFWLCMFMFVASTDYLSWMFNGIRQFTAVCIILLSFEFVLEKKYISAIVWILLAASIHGSALLMLPILLVIQGEAWNKRTLFMLIGILAAIMFISQFTSLLDGLLSETQYSDMVTNEIWINDDGTNPFRVLFYSIPAILSLVGKRYVNKEEDTLVNLCINCAICTSLIYILSAFTSGIYIGRIPILTTLQGYAVVPWLIDHIFTKDSARLVKGLLMGGFLAFFYYQMHIAWGIL